MADVVTPRLVYKGPADDNAETKMVGDPDALDAALKEGWRLRRVPVKAAADAKDKK